MKSQVTLSSQSTSAGAGLAVVLGGLEWVVGVVLVGMAPLFLLCGVFADTVRTFSPEFAPLVLAETFVFAVTDLFVSVFF